MPKTAVNENDGVVSRKAKIGIARQVLAMNPIPEATRVEAFSNHELRLSVFASDAGHHTASCY